MRILCIDKKIYHFTFHYESLFIQQKSLSVFAKYELHCKTMLHVSGGSEEQENNENLFVQNILLKNQGK